MMTTVEPGNHHIFTIIAIEAGHYAGMHTDIPRPSTHTDAEVDHQTTIDVQPAIKAYTPIKLLW